MTQYKNIRVKERYQIALPKDARKRLNIRVGDKLLIDVQDGLLIILPHPKRYTTRLAGLHKEIWQSVDTKSYLDEERGAWGGSVTS
jgi:AbrB family looped-hinge helix DNA binding protein